MEYGIFYTPYFVKKYGRYSVEEQEEIKQAIELLGQKKNHKQLKVHKLRCKLRRFYFCSVNYKTRLIFQMHKPNDLWLMDIGSHQLYR